jgi:hypothetical protein
MAANYAARGYLGWFTVQYQVVTLLLLLHTALFAACCSCRAPAVLGPAPCLESDGCETVPGEVILGRESGAWELRGAAPWLGPWCADPCCW